eukprot:Lankesteria_metandrocarpae@DN3096_c0_g1_i1.p1
MRMNSCLALSAAIGCAAIWTLFTFFQSDSIITSREESYKDDSRAQDNPSKLFMRSTARFLPARFSGSDVQDTGDSCPPCPDCVGAGKDPMDMFPKKENIIVPAGTDNYTTGTRRTKSLVDNYLLDDALVPTNYEVVGGRLLIHSWFEGSSLFPGFELLLKGYLVSQDLQKTLFVMWITEDWLNSTDPVKPYIIEKYRYHPNIQFRIFDKAALVVGTCWADREEFMLKTTIQTYGMRDYSNVVRWLLLYVYGGVWLDADSIPLLDLTYLHVQHPTTLLAAHSVATEDEKRKFPDRPKEWGMFNNNFLMVTNPKMRVKIMEVACTFRRRPLLEGEQAFGNEPFVNVIPVVGEDKHEQYVMNHWLFNDGTLRNCWIRDDCAIDLIDLGATDPVWVRSNDMYAICERVIQSMDRYTAHFSDLLKSRYVEGGLWSYLDSHNFNDSSWIVHNRLAHCRTAKTVPIGMSKWFGDLMEFHLHNGNPLTAPTAAQNVIAYDPFEETKADHEIDFVPLIIAVESFPEDTAGRTFIRSQLKNRDYFPDIHESVSRVPKVFFIVPYSEAHSDWNAKLHLELYTHNDLILVNPYRKDLPVALSCLVSPVVRSGMLKILKRHDSRFVTILFGSPTRVFVHVRNLFYLLNTASGLGLFNKEKNIDSFIITHRVDDDLEKQLLNYNSTPRAGNNDTAGNNDSDTGKEKKGDFVLRRESSNGGAKNDGRDK